MGSLAEPLPEPPRLARRRADGRHGQVARDRLVTMLVLAGLLHGLIILGVSFSTPRQGDEPLGHGMEVLLVSDELPEANSNPTATYLSQRTQTGSGNTRQRQRAQLPAAAHARPPKPRNQIEPPIAGDEQLLTGGGQPRLSTIQVLPVPEQPTPDETQLAQRAGDDDLKLRGETRDELYVTADTRASRLAPYLDGWRRRVERIGTINYPSVAQRRGMTGNPVIEVVLQSDGKLRSAHIQRSSGHPEIDAAALDILRLASPFDPFPDDLARDYRSLRFAYEWQFDGGRTGPGTLAVP